jgi:ethanolamine permease
MSLTAAMITMAVFGAIVMYIMSMLSLFRLRKIAPDMARSFRAPGYPWVPAIALMLAVVCLVAMLWFNLVIGAVFVLFMACGYLYFTATKVQRHSAPKDLMLEGE